MSQEGLLREIGSSLSRLDSDGVKKFCADALASGIEPARIIQEGLAKGMVVIGDGFEKGEYFLADLIIAAEIMKEMLEILKPHIEGEGGGYVGRIVLGTVQGDVHDIGRSIVSSFLSVAGFDVIDLGIDVPNEKFIQVVREQSPQILGMSALLTTTMAEMETVIKMLEKADLRRNLKVILGGGSVGADFAKRIGADHAARDAADGVRVCREWVSH